MVRKHTDALQLLRNCTKNDFYSYLFNHLPIWYSFLLWCHLVALARTTIIITKTFFHVFNSNVFIINCQCKSPSLVCFRSNFKMCVCIPGQNPSAHYTCTENKSFFWPSSTRAIFFNVFIYCKATILHWNLAVHALRPLCIPFSTKAVLDGCVMLKSLHHHLLHDLQLCALAKQSTKRIKSIFTTVFTSLISSLYNCSAFAACVIWHFEGAQQQQLDNNIYIFSFFF